MSKASDFNNLINEDVKEVNKKNEGKNNFVSFGDLDNFDPNDKFYDEMDNLGYSVTYEKPGPDDFKFDDTGDGGFTVSDKGLKDAKFLALLKKYKLKLS